MIQFEHKGENSHCGTKPRKPCHRQNISRKKNVKILKMLTWRTCFKVIYLNIMFSGLWIIEFKFKMLPLLSQNQSDQSKGLFNAQLWSQYHFFHYLWQISLKSDRWHLGLLYIWHCPVGVRLGLSLFLFINLYFIFKFTCFYLFPNSFSWLEK